MTSAPAVSIGLPVYNGATYLRQALEANLVQTFADFELIVSDNASTDETLAICEEHARADARVRILRQPSNCGVNRNHAKVLEAARGEFFRWASADDVPSPGLVEHAVACLRADPGLVAYVPDTANIDASGRFMRHLERTLDLQERSAVDRAAAVLSRDYQMVFPQGLIRRSAMPLGAGYWHYFGWDFILLFELALAGRLANVTGPLLHRRLHDERAAQNTHKVAEVRRWVDPTAGSRILMPHWRWTWERMLATVRSPLTVGDRVRILRIVARDARWNRRLFARDIAMALKLYFGRTDEFPF